MKERELKELGEALVREISTNMTPKKLVKAVQKAHTEATKANRARGVLRADGRQVSRAARKRHTFATWVSSAHSI